MAITEAQKIVFALGPRQDGADLVIGVPADGWTYMKDGMTHTVDLARLGLPLRVILFGAADRATALAIVARHNASLGNKGLQSRLDEDFGIKDATPATCPHCGRPPG